MLSTVKPFFLGGYARMIGAKAYEGGGSCAPAEQGQLRKIAGSHWAGPQTLLFHSVLESNA